MIELRFGLRGEQPFTLEEVGRAFGVTRERIRQIENNTLKKLESLPEAQALKNSCNGDAGVVAVSTVRGSAAGARPCARARRACSGGT